LVAALNVIDQYKDWKTMLKAIAERSNKYVNFSTLMRLDGPTILDDELSFTHYPDRALWAIHNVFSLIAYCTTEQINASKIYIYCYNKPLEHSVHPIHPKDLYVGNVMLEIDREKSWDATNKVPQVQIVVSGNTYYSNTKEAIF